MPSVKEPEPIDFESAEEFRQREFRKRKNGIWHGYLERAGGDAEQAKQLVFEVIGPLPSKDWTRDDLDKLEKALTEPEPIEPEMVEEGAAEPEITGEKSENEPEIHTEDVNEPASMEEPEPEKKVRKSRKKEEA